MRFSAHRLAVGQATGNTTAPGAQNPRRSLAYSGHDNMGLREQGIEPANLRVMGPARCRCAIPHRQQKNPPSERWAGSGRSSGTTELQAILDMFCRTVKSPAGFSLRRWP